MSNFNSVKILEVLDKVFRKKYDKKAKLEEVGINYSGSSAILNYINRAVDLLTSLNMILFFILIHKL